MIMLKLQNMKITGCRRLKALLMVVFTGWISMERVTVL